MRCGTATPTQTSPTRRLVGLRLAALEGRLTADLAVGRHVEVAAELDALTREHPYHERLRVLQMLALYRAGRQADALEVYERVRITLAHNEAIRHLVMGTPLADWPQWVKDTIQALHNIVTDPDLQPGDET